MYCILNGNKCEHVRVNKLGTLYCQEIADGSVCPDMRPVPSHGILALTKRVQETTKRQENMIRSTDKLLGS